jgi:hypothetical protein
MKTISVEDLHEQTDQFVGLAAQEDIVVVQRGQPLAILKRFPDAVQWQRHWEEREQKLATLPRIDVDSTEYVSQDRDGR